MASPEPTPARTAFVDCPFCQIVCGIAPAEIVQRWDDAIAIVPLNPVTPGHVLIIPNEHVTDALHDPNVAASMMRHAAALSGSQCNIITSAGPYATQTVFHLHVHVVPRRRDDGLALPWAPADPTQPVPGPTRPWTVDVEYVGGAQRTDYGTGTEDDGQWQWAIFNGPPEQMGSLVLLGMAEDEDPTPVLAALVAEHNRSVVPGPTREQIHGVLSPDEVEVLRQAPADQDVTARTQLAVSHENLRALLPAHPSPTDDGCLSEDTVRQWAEIERLRAHQGTA